MDFSLLRVIVDLVHSLKVIPIFSQCIMGLSLIDIHFLRTSLFLFNEISLLNSLFLQKLLSKYNMTLSLEILLIVLLSTLHPLLINIISPFLSILVLMSILTAKPVPLIFFEIMMMSPHFLFLMFLLFFQTFLRILRVIFQVLFC